MKNKLGMAVVAFLSMFVTGCLTAPFEPPVGLFTDVQAPLSIDHSKTVVTSKRGKATAISVLGLVAVGDASTQAAAEDGRLKVIHHLDYRYLNVLGIYQSATVIAHGE